MYNPDIQSYHRFVHQSARRARSGGVSTFKINDFPARVFCDRSPKTHILKFCKFCKFGRVPELTESNKLRNILLSNNKKAATAYLQATPRLKKRHVNTFECLQIKVSFRKFVQFQILPLTVTHWGGVPSKVCVSARLATQTGGGVLGH